MNIRFSHSWRWNRFDIGFGAMWDHWGVDFWACFGFWWFGFEITRRW